MRPYFLVFFLVLFLSGDALAADDVGKIDIPASAQVEQEGDLSLAVITRIFGNTADSLIGSGAEHVDDAEGFISGLVTAILGVLNFAAMIYVSSMIIYMWGVFAVTTAHSGEKLGGGIYNSLWIPVRHAMSFGLTIPIIKGFSMMQVIILFLIGLSINFANAIWNFSGDYLIKNVRVHVTAQAYRDAAFHAEKFAPVMFTNSVVQSIIADKEMADYIIPFFEKTYKAYDPGAKNSPGDYNGYDPENREGLAIQEFPIDWYGNPDPDGDLLRIDDYLNGRIIIRQRDMRYVRFGFWDFHWFDDRKERDPGLISIAMPKWSRQPTATNNYGYNWGYQPYIDESKLFDPESSEVLKMRESYIFTGKTDTPDYKIRRAFAEKKVRHVVDLWRTMAEAGIRYAHSYASAGDSCAIQPCKYEADEAHEFMANAIDSGIKAYAEGITEDSAKSVEELMAATGLSDREQITRMLESAIDSKDGKSTLGWMSAGLMPFTMATMQQRLYQAANADTATYAGSISNAILKFEDEDQGHALNRNYLNGIKRSPDFFMQSQQHRLPSYGATYIAQSYADEGMLDLKKIQDAIITHFDGHITQESYGGVLGWVLQQVASQDPILVLQGFGQRLFDAATSPEVLAGAVFFALFSAASIAACIGLVFVGLFFAYAVPFMPVVYWIKALVSWVFMVVEVMVAAPFWVCAHALPEGKGFAGSHARRGYMMLLDIVARPALLVIGAVFAIILAQVCGVLIHTLFNVWFVNVIRVDSMSVFSDVVYAIIVMSVIYGVYWTCFTKGVMYMPERVLQWCGGVTAGGLRDEEEGTQSIMHAGGAIDQVKGQGKALGDTTGGLVGSGGRGLGKMLSR